MSHTAGQVRAAAQSVGLTRPARSGRRPSLWVSHGRPGQDGGPVCGSHTAGEVRTVVQSVGLTRPARSGRWPSMWVSHGRPDQDGGPVCVSHTAGQVRTAAQSVCLTRPARSGRRPTLCLTRPARSGRRPSLWVSHGRPGQDGGPVCGSHTAGQIRTAAQSESHTAGQVRAVAQSVCLTRPARSGRRRAVRRQPTAPVSGRPVRGRSTRRAAVSLCGGVFAHRSAGVRSLSWPGLGQTEPNHHWSRPAAQVSHSVCDSVLTKTKIRKACL